jgi:hypothetical protein
VADPNVLQSFVIKLNYSVDDVSIRRFNQGIKQSIEGLNTVRIAALAVVVGIEEMVRRTTSAYASLDFLAKSSGTSAAAIEHLSSLFIGAGMSAEQARATVNQLGTEFQTVPGRMELARQAIGQNFSGVNDFMIKATEKYNQLLQEAHGDPLNYKVRAYVDNLTQTVGAAATEQIRQLSLNWKAAEDFAKRVDKIYEETGVNVAKAAEDARKASLAFELLGKTLQIAFVELLTRPSGPENKTLLDYITEIADKLRQWLIDPETQKQFTALFDRILVLLPAIEWAISHIDKIIIGMLALWAADKALNLLLFFKGLSTIFKGLGAARAAAPAAVGESVLGLFFRRFLVWGSAAGGAYEAGKTVIDPHSRDRMEDEIAKGGLFNQKWLDPFYLLGRGIHGIFGSYQHGGIVPINAHAGEMVLPTSISQGLQSFFSGGSGGLFSTSRRMLDSFVAWFSGDSAYKPQIEFGDETLERLGLAGEDAASSGGKGHGDEPPPANTIEGPPGPGAVGLEKYAVGNAAKGGPSPVAGVHPEFADRIERMVAAMPPALAARFRIYSGYRSQTRQEQVHPGVDFSHHTGGGEFGSGMAVDTSTDPEMLAWIHAHPEFGVGYPLAGPSSGVAGALSIPGEEHHLEPLEGGRRVAPSQMVAWRAAQDRRRAEEAAKKTADEEAKKIAADGAKKAADEAAKKIAQPPTSEPAPGSQGAATIKTIKDTVAKVAERAKQHSIAFRLAALRSIAHADAMQNAAPLGSRPSRIARVEARHEQHIYVHGNDSPTHTAAAVQQAQAAANTRFARDLTRRVA